MEIALYHDLYRGEHAVANGWFERAGALLEDCPDTPERAWLMLWRAHVHIHVRDEMPAGREALAGALRLNLRCQVEEIDTMARGLAGLALISDGDVEGGLRRLDEATAMAIAGDRFRPETVGFACCYVLEACETVRDFDARAAVAGARMVGRPLARRPPLRGLLPLPLRGHPDVARQIPGRRVRESTRCAQRSRRSRRPGCPIATSAWGRCAAGKAATRTQSGCCSRWPHTRLHCSRWPGFGSRQTTLMARSAWSSVTSAA